MKVTMNQLYEMKDAFNTEGALKADIYFADEKGLPGRVVAEARDIHGTERVLVVRVDGWVTNPADYESAYSADDLIAHETLAKLAAKTLGSIKSEKKAASSAANGKLGGRPRKNEA